MSTDERPHLPDQPRQVISHLRAAALAAICALTNPHADPAQDPNPYTGRLEAYDLARLFNLDPSGRGRDVAVDLDDVMTVVRGTSPVLERRRVRALWVAAELRRMGHSADADLFEQLAAD